MGNFVWSDVSFSIENQLHVLRHFSKIDKGYKYFLQKLNSNTRQVINQILKTPGSKFNPTFVSNPLELFAYIKNNAQQSDLQLVRDRCEIFVNVNRDIYPFGIGFDNLIPLSLLSESDLLTLKQIQRDSFTVNAIYKNSDNPTWQINCIIVRENDQIKIKTIFPGIMAPPFPDISYQTESEYKENITFWREYAFIK
jgi:hypothetical protein